MKTSLVLILALALIATQVECKEPLLVGTFYSYMAIWYDNLLALPIYNLHYYSNYLIFSLWCSWIVVPEFDAYDESTMYDYCFDGVKDELRKSYYNYY